MRGASGIAGRVSVQIVAYPQGGVMRCPGVLDLPTRPVRLKFSSRQADDRLLRLRFAIIIAPGNLRPCRGGDYVPVFGLLLPDRMRMVCIWRKISHRERGSGR
jgi:hypothetical protein